MEEDRGIHEFEAERKSWLPDVGNDVEDLEPVELPAEDFDIDVIGDVNRDGESRLEIP